MELLSESRDAGSGAEHGLPGLFTAPYGGRAREPEDLVQYLARFDVPLGDLEPRQVAMFVAARNAAHYVEDLEVPIASRPGDSGEDNPVERNTEEVLDLTVYDSDYHESDLPTDEMDVNVIGSVEDLPRIFPTQWLLEEMCPDVFYARLAQRELLMPEWQRPTQRPRDGCGEVPQRELAEARAPARSTRQHAYVLLDTSRTMNDHDRRGTVARGLALAFLLKGHADRARLHLRPFTAEVGALSSGLGRDDLREIALRIAGIPNSGQTRIQTALEQAVSDIRGAGPCWRADVMLITDGISRLSQNPLGRERLHTFVLGDLFEEDRDTGTVRTLQQWSHTYHRIWQNRFAEILAPTLRDVQAAGRLLEAAVEQCRADPSPARADRLRRLRENVRFLVRRLRDSLAKGDSLPPEIGAVEEHVRHAEQVPAPAARHPRLGPGRPLSASGRTPGSRARGAGAAGGISPEGIHLWEHLRRWATRTWRWVRQTCSRLLRDGP